MGVPKFYRWISERYPCLSEVIKEYQIPEFDNLYFDMNGIIHVCSHPNDDDPHFRITEEKIFADICHYIDFLFKMIKPQKAFFMAVDGVAPRAKMNQQRGRRFRTAKDATILEQRARESGEQLPSEARFDSNCITPGTEFMARLHEVLKSFVQHKITTDKLWQNIRVYLSGHETPGEGEHKIMDFIRNERSQKNYDPNTRHCLYGLDADLIMLGLCSHEPHFSLLREEIIFGKKSNSKRTMTPEETTFHLLHLSLLREYLEYEFQSAKDKIDFAFDVEKIIDDFVLMTFLVGNDFIPHLPQMHIHHDALPILFKTYIDVLPSMGGYINENGYLNLVRFEIFFKKLAEFDYMKFGEVSDFAPPGSKTKSEIIEDADDMDNILEKLVDLGFSKETLNKTTEYDSDSGDESDDFELEFRQHKHHYYRDKLEYENVTPQVLRDQAEGYVRAIQWNLHYYYNGISSWSWYYPHHYAPYISDVQNFKDMNLNFELGEPFLPFQQLLAVLPSLSMNLLPEAYQKLMIDGDSPVVDYYPLDFQTDLNGKKQDWEAVVLIPFINEKLLLKCTAEADKTLTPEEKKRNQHGPHLLYTSSKQPIPISTPLTLPSCFPPLTTLYAKCQLLPKDFFRLPAEKIKKGLCDGVQLNVLYPGFPTLKHIKHTAHLSNEDVRVFQMISQRDNMMLTVEEIVSSDLKKIADSVLGKDIYVGWPHLVKANVGMVSDIKTTYSIENSNITEAETDSGVWKSMVESVKEQHYKRLGIFLREITVLVHAKPLIGSRVLWDDKLIEEIQWTQQYSRYPLNTVIQNIKVHSSETKTKKMCKDLFPVGTAVFMLGKTYYGSMGTIVDNDVVKNRGCVSVKFEIPEEPDMRSVIQNKKRLASLKYVPGYVLAQQLGISGYFLSRLTGTFLIQTNSKESLSPNRVNVGLNLKFNKKNEEVAGFSKKNEDNQWLYSSQVRETLEKYFKEFPEFFEILIPLADQDVVYLEDLYSLGTGKDVIRDITNWLKMQQCTSAERQSCGLNTLDEGIVAAIEEVVDTISATGNITNKTMFVKPTELYNPLLCKGCVIPDCKTEYQLFDRVINVSHTITVPLGLRGTVIGIRGAERSCDYVYDVVFDRNFFGGIKLHCTLGRGYHMPPSALLNLSYGDRITGNIRSPKKKVNLSFLRSLVDTNLSNNNLPLPNTHNKQSEQGAFSQNSKHASGSDLYPQIQILRKESQPTSYNQPFYKNDSFTSPISNQQSVDSNFLLNESSDSPSNYFILPKAGQKNNRTSLGNAKSIPGTEYNMLWDGLLNKSIDKSPFSEKSSVNQDAKQQFGKAVTVQELFSAFEKHTAHDNKQLNTDAKISTPKDMPQNFKQAAFEPQSKQIATIELMNYCIAKYQSPPVYTYKTIALNNWHIATVILPDASTFMSIQCPDKADAGENAAEKALAVLKGSHSNFNSTAIHKKMNYHIPYNASFVNSNPNPPMPFPRAPAYPFFLPPPPPSFMEPTIRFPATEIPIIPDSFVKQNQMILAGHNTLAHVKKFIPTRTMPLTQSNIRAPFNGMMTEQSSHVKPKENVFVPLQVQRHSVTKKPPVEGAPVLADHEWPSLSSSKKESKQKTPQDSATALNTIQDSNTEPSISLQDVAKEISKHSKQTNPTEPKRRKPRLAAMIPNLSE